MAKEIRNDGSLFLATLVSNYNTLVDSLLTTQKHRDKTSQQTGTYLVPASTPITIPAFAFTADEDGPIEDGYIAGVNSVRQVLDEHLKDDSAHEVADTVNVLYADGYDYPVLTLDDAIVLANLIKVDYTAHLDQTDVHVNDDATNTIVADDATDIDELGVLLLDFRSKINSHMASAGATQRFKIVSP